MVYQMGDCVFGWYAACMVLFKNRNFFGELNVQHFIRLSREVRQIRKKYISSLNGPAIWCISHTLATDVQPQAKSAHDHNAKTKQTRC